MTVQREVIEPLLSYPDSRAYANFLRGINTTVTNIDYSRGLQTFIEWSKVSEPDQLLSGTSEEQEDRIIDFIEDQKSKGLAYATIRQRLAAIQHLYAMNRKTLAWKFITKHLGRGGTKRDRAYRHDELAAMIESGDYRENALVLVTSSSGIREQALAPLNFSHLTPMNTPYGKIYRFIVYQGEEEEYATFCSPEAAKSLDNYKEYRARYGEVVTPDSPVFRNDFNRRNLESVRKARRLTTKGIQDIFYMLAVNSGIRKKIHVEDKNKRGSIRHEVKLVHGMKKFASTNMGRAGVNPTYRSYMLSHKKGHRELGIDRLEMIYDRPEESDLLKEYIKAIPSLTVSSEERTKLELAEAVKKIHGEQQILEEIEKLRSERKQLIETEIDLRMREYQRKHGVFEGGKLRPFDEETD